MPIDGACRDIAVKTPHVTKQLLAADCSASMFDEVAKDVVLQRGKLYRPAEVVRIPLTKIDLDVAKPVGEIVDDIFAAGPPHDCANAEREFFHIEGLGHIVVGSELECTKFIFLTCVNSDHDHRRIDAGTPSLA